MDLSLQNRTVLITASAGGIGLAMALFVCSAQASAINGAALRVDGGILRSVF